MKVYEVKGQRKHNYEIKMEADVELWFNLMTIGEMLRKIVNILSKTFWPKNLFTKLEFSRIFFFLKKDVYNKEKKR